MINSTYKKANRLLYIIFLMCFVQLGFAQIFPVQVNSNVIPPYLSSVSKYTTTTDQKYLVNIFTNDLSVVNRQVKLKLYIQGNGINAQSAPVVVGANPLFINGGENLQLNNLDLAPYFELQNLQGINPQQYSGVLPQGSYNFCIEVYDFVTNQPISQKSCTFFYFIYNEPPLLNLPFNHDVIHFQDPQNIIFTWTPRHSNATNIEYEFTLIELIDNQAPSNYAFIVGAPVWQEVLNNTILNYNFNYPQLTAGKKYAWRVKALTQPGFGEDAVFNNNGYSEIYDFVYAGNCNTPEFVLAQSTSATQAKILWQNNPNHLSNNVKYRKLGTQEWFNAPVANGQALLLDLEPIATYEFQVGGICLGDIASFSAINQFTQPAKDVVAINCGIAPTIDLTNVTLYNEELKKDMVFMAADYAIHINESQGVGTYTGKGWTRAPFFKNLKIAVEFENIKLNSELKLVEGEVKAQYDPSWGNILDVNEVIDVIDDILDPLQASNDVHSYQVNFVIGSTANITVQNGQIIITTPQGTTGAIFDFDKGENTTITDVNGTVYTVDPKGNVTLGQQGTGIANSSNTENINSDGKVTALSTIGAKVVFKRSSSSEAFDDSSADYTNLPSKLASKYKTIKDGDDNDYPFYYKAVVNKENGTRTFDYVTAEITITDTIVKAKDIIFNLKGLKLNATDSITNGNVTIKTLEIPVFTTIGEPELLALVKNGTGKQKVIGAMTVIPIKDVGIVNISLVPVNGATISSDDIVAVQRIYSQAGVNLNITTLPAYQDRSITTLECGTSGFIANYTTEQNAFIDRYKATKTISNNQYLLFVTKDIAPSRPISGFMPLHRQVGFIFTGQSQSSTEEVKETSGSGLATVIAHEIGHGVFELQHPWEQYDYSKNSFSTNWLMDYASGTKLPYMHWQQISHPKTALYLFQSDSSGEFNGGFAISPDFKFISVNSQSTTSADVDVPNGTLYGFVEEDGKYYVWNGTNFYYDRYDIEKKPFTKLNTKLPKDEDSVFLFYDSKNICGLKKYLVVTYKDVKLIKSLKDLSDFVVKNQAKGERLDCKRNDDKKGWTNDEGNKNISGLYVVNLIKPGKFKEEVVNKLKELVSSSSTNRITNENHHIKSRILLTSELAADNEYIVSIKTEGGKEYFYIDATKQEIISDEIIFWIEYNKEGKIRIKHIITGSQFDEGLAIALKSWDSQLEWQQKTFFEKFLSTSYNVVDDYFTSAYDLLDMLGSGIGKLKIPPSVYDCKASNYNSIYADVFSYVNFTSIAQDVVAEQLSEFYPNIKTILANGKPSQIQFALFCGLYNGLIDVIKSVPDLAKLIVSPLSEKGRSSNSEFIQSISNIVVKKEMPDGTQQEIYGKGLSPSKIGYLIKELIGKQFDTSQPCKTAEFVGSIAGPFIVMCFGDEIAAEGIASKIFSTTLKTINICSKITDPFNYLGLSFKFVKQITGKLTVVGENVAGDVIHQVADNVFNAKLVTEAGTITKEISEETLEKIIVNTAKGEATEILIDGVKKGVRILGAVLPNTTSIFKEFVAKTRNLALASAITFQMVGAPIATISKSADNIIEHAIQIAGRTDIPADVTNVLSKIENQAAEQFTNAVTSSIKKAPNTVAQQGKLIMLEAVDQTYDVLALKIGDQIDYLVIKATQAANNSATNLPVYRIVKNATEQNPKCDYCPEVNTVNSEMCKKLTLLGRNTNNKIAVEKLCKKSISLDVVNKVLGYTIAQQKTFVDDFAEISTLGMNTLIAKLHLADYWKDNASFYKTTRPYHADDHKDWTSSTQTVKTMGAREKLLVEAIDYKGIHNQDTLNAQTIGNHGTLDAKIVSSGNLPNANIVIKYNRKKYNNAALENSDLEYNNFIKTLHPFLQKHIEYMDFIRNDCSNNSDGKLFEKLYGGKVALSKLRQAQRPGIHTEVQVLNDLIKDKSINSVADIRALDIKIVIKWNVKDNEMKHMVTCPHCFYITEGVFFPNNK